MLTGLVQWSAQERVVHGRPAAQALVEEFDRTGVRRVLLLTTRSLTNGRLVADIMAALGSRCVGKFDAIGAHSPRESVIGGAALARGTQADHLLAVGGGSVIDATKVMLLALWRDIHDIDALAKLAQKRGDPLPRPHGDETLRMTAVPTTLSAAEFTSHAGVTDVQRKVKLSFGHPLMAPRAAILDPAATADTPMELLLSTGMRSMDHAVERWCSVKPHPLADGLSLQAMEMLAQCLPVIRANPTDLDARMTGQLAAWLTQVSAAPGVPNGASHGIGYILGGYCGVPHGVTSCISLAPTLEWNAPVNGERQAVIATKLGRPDLRPCDAMREFVRSLGVPARLGDVGIGRERLAEIAAQWDGSGPIATNPRKVTGAADLVEILELAL